MITTFGISCVTSCTYEAIPKASLQPYCGKLQGRKKKTICGKVWKRAELIKEWTACRSRPTHGLCQSCARLVSPETQPGKKQSKGWDSETAAIDAPGD